MARTTELPCIHDKPSTQALNQALQKETNFNTSSDSLFEGRWEINGKMLNKFKHSKAKQTTLASKLPSSQLNYPQQHNRRKRHVLSHVNCFLDCCIYLSSLKPSASYGDRLRIIGGHLNLAAEEKAPKRNAGVV
ncbi:hypothetical protein HID58_047918 [Brassica napus]|uniref:Uncharacterized protein n=1 Tax=Brassica napus TaxID=3708 RepID=A0ABQ8B0M7_BRANA|nr:hypothetical protein HID58_047918 [Brassica napus]